jgi:GTP-binding protein YchF
MLRAGLIGYPATGKTTLFRLLTGTLPGAHGAHGRADAHVGVARVPDPRLDRLGELFAPRRVVPATVEFADLGAAKPAGATAWLDVAPFRQADALVHVVRAFTDPGVPHVAATIDPARDVRTLDEELVLADLGLVERRLERLARDLKKGAAAELKGELDVLERCRAHLEAGHPLRTLALAPEAARRLRGFQLLSAKPLLVVVNLDESEVARAEAVVAAADLSARLAEAGAAAVAVCAKLEVEIAELEAPDRAAFLAALGIGESGLDRVIRASYELLGYISFFTVGEHECRAWSVPRGTSAHAAAGEVHSDMARGFIRAEVVPYTALVARGSFAACRQHGELRLEGKDYIVQDGDVMLFRFAT